MKTITKFNRNKGSVIFISLIAVFFQCTLATGQSINNGKMRYRGVDVSFGTRSMQLQSDIKELDELMVSQQGGQAGIIFGGEVVRTKIGVAGFFYSADKMARTVDLFQSDLSINFYPLERLGRFIPVQPYITGGAVYNKTKFFGNYLSDDKSTVNYSTTKEIFLGNIHQLSGFIGVGVEFKVVNDEFNFFHLFSEVKYASCVAQKTSNAAFNNTTSSGQWMVTIGVRFGSHE